MNTIKHAAVSIAVLAVVCLALPASAQVHSADITSDYEISLSELLRVIQFLSAGTR